TGASGPSSPPSGAPFWPWTWLLTFASTAGCDAAGWPSELLTSILWPMGPQSHASCLRGGAQGSVGVIENAEVIALCLPHCVCKIGTQRRYLNLRLSARCCYICLILNKADVQCPCRVD
ncbi:hypothetical protein H5410_037269, partial [Solanum commersonii]